MAETSLLIEPREPRDAEWRQELQNITGVSDAIYEELTLPADDLRAQLTAYHQHGANPNFRPHQVNISAAMQREADLQSFKDELLSREQDPLIAQAYRWRINELIANNRMLVAAADGDERRFDAYNHFIYGAPSLEVFNAGVAFLRDQAHTALGRDNPLVVSAAEDALHLLPEVNGDSSLIQPTPEVFAAIRQQHLREGGFYALLLAGITMPDTPKIANQPGDDILRGVLTNIGAEHYAIANASGSAWSVNHNKQQMNRPASYNMITRRFVGLGLGHESGTHILERVNGLRQPLQLAGLGLDRNEPGEGRATMREQVLYPTFADFAKTLRWQDIIRRDVAIGLLAGIDQGGQKRTFADVYPIINAVDNLWEHKKAQPADKAAATAQKRTEDLLAKRVMRGTNGTGAYHKDRLYLEGNAACWQIAVAHPDLIAQGDLGKFDITNPRHIALLQAFGVLPKINENI